MATRNIVPRANEEGNIGTSIKRWLKGWFKDVFVSGNITNGTQVVTVAGLSAVVREVAYAESEGESTTTESTYQTKLRMTFTPTYTADYLLKWSYEVGSASANKTFETEVDRNSGTLLSELQQTISSNASYSIINSGIEKIALTAGVQQTFDILYKVIDAQTLKIRRARMFIEKVS